ncbi:hypothetical protein SAMN05216312_102239 [Cohnella sp. OV330]|uniref:hypothetical protein n=1 Tax=Cohnella sp. OV330 TaxID=1855288 RepID=UPI0008E36C3F|nr:hypothetical protein [Cohnella sp. OV330]SFA91920.1 hypothetical protein SAMN05216312_102239 [Cohnella sp. OV330]
MLPDLERKLLRILAAYVFKHKRFPSMWILWRKTGRREADLLRSLKSLKEKGYIDWEAAQHAQARILKEWEDGVNLRPQKEVRSIDPWEMESF